MATGTQIITHKYGSFSSDQLQNAKHELRKGIFFLLLIADPNNKAEYKDVDTQEAFDNLMMRMDGLNELLSHPTYLVMCMGLLEEARKVYQQEPFNFKRYRKLILDAGNEVIKIEKGGGQDA